MTPKETGDPVNTGNPVDLSQLLVTCRTFYAAQEAHRTAELKNWHNERQGLLKRIRELEDTVVSLTTSMLTLSQSNHGPPTSNSTSRAIWEGPESVTTRTFPDIGTSYNNASTANQTQNIEDAKRKMSFGFDPFSRSSSTRDSSLSGVDGEVVHPDYAGINIRPSAIPEELRKKVEDTAAHKLSSPYEKENADDQIPQIVVRPKLLDIPTANMRSEELYSADAGHTPLARVTGSEGTTGDMTPVPPKRPHSSVEASAAPNVRPPSERQDSYFANAQLDGQSDGDRILKEPLGVSADNSSSQDAKFLERVNLSLERQLSTQMDESELPSPAEKGHRRIVSEADDGGPRLRLKQSTNFGAPFGQSEA